MSVAACQEVRLFHYGESGHDSYVIEIPEDSLKDWCMHLFLLQLGGVDRLLIGPSEEGRTMSVGRIGAGEVNVHRGIYAYHGSVLSVDLPQDQIELWIWFILQHVFTEHIRPKAGYTDHIDVESVSSRDPADRVVDLMITMERPMRGNEG